MLAHCALCHKVVFSQNCLLLFCFIVLDICLALTAAQANGMTCSVHYLSVDKLKS